MSRVALVTGANQGIGYGIVRRLCKEHPDWIVYGTSRSAANGDEAAKKLKEEGLTATFLKADLTDAKTISDVKEKLLKDHGGLDVLVNNAGMAFKAASTEPYAHKVEVTLATNVFGTNMVCDTLFPILKDGARVVILSSLVAPMALHKVKKLHAARYESFIKSNPPMPRSEVLSVFKGYEASVKAGTFEADGWADDAAYSLSKLGDTLLTRAMQEEFNKTPERDIVVNAADPGYVNTSMSSGKGPLTIDQGADSPYYLAQLPPKTDIRGAHVSKREIIPWK